MTDKTRSAVAILQESLDTIKATFWIQQKEFSFAEAQAINPLGVDGEYGEYGEYLPPSQWDWTSWETVNKAILVDLDQDHWGSEPSILGRPNGEGHIQGKVTGVCSIGALALANVSLYDEPLTTFENISGRDIHTWMAGAALAMEMAKQNIVLVMRHDEHGGIIANWNDAAGRTREEVIEIFEKAIDSDLAKADPTTVVRLSIYRTDGVYPHRYTPLVFMSEEEGQAFLTRHPEVGTRYRLNQLPDNLERYTAKFERLEHGALARV